MPIMLPTRLPNRSAERPDDRATAGPRRANEKAKTRPHSHTRQGARGKANDYQCFQGWYEKPKRDPTVTPVRGARGNAYNYQCFCFLSFFRCFMHFFHVCLSFFFFFFSLFYLFIFFSFFFSVVARRFWRDFRSQAARGLTWFTKQTIRDQTTMVCRHTQPFHCVVPLVGSGSRVRLGSTCLSVSFTSGCGVYSV